MKLYKEQEKNNCDETYFQLETSYVTACLKHDPSVHSCTPTLLTSYLESWMHSHYCSSHVTLSTTVTVYIMPANVQFSNIFIPHIQFHYATSNLMVIFTSSEVKKWKCIQNFNTYYFIITFVTITHCFSVVMYNTTLHD